MGTLWYCLVAVMLAVYVVLDGFDLGAGIIHLFVARTDDERRLVIQSIGPVWDGNEVWLLAGGGTLYFAFPSLYASSFSGFYLPLMMVLWLLILRGTSVEFRSHVSDEIWASFWDAVFALSGILLAVFYGAALGNVVRGVPLDSNGRFFEPLWTNFLPGADAGVLDWYTIVVGVTALAVLSLHGAVWVALKTEATLNERARAAARRAWWAVAVLTIIITIASFRVQPSLTANFSAHVWGFAFPILAIAGFLGVGWFLRAQNERAAFLSSCGYLLGMLTSVAFSLYPRLLPASTNPLFALTIENAKAPQHGLHVGLAWWLVGMSLASAYSVYTYRNFAGKMKPAASEQHY
ncbi:MAG TPA: cytochrome d ubiquinol oxidase subunit II [Candidatus Acidoferrum sp.]|nr:cytochrome d ubiquinol oxidase subunit II [Candidatus Acidoferrum sp.]